MRTSIAILAALSLVLSANAWKNTPPIPERHPGWGEGKGKLLIDIELFMDLTCDGCAVEWPEFQKFLGMNYLGSQVRDQIFVNYVIFALPYHHASWIPQRLLPFIIDQCVSTKNQVCKYTDYLAYALKNRATFLAGTNLTYDALTTWWIN
jgi:hypothetical protein